MDPHQGDVPMSRPRQARFPGVAPLLVAGLFLATPAGALEKSSSILPAERDDWHASDTTTIAYYNTCTGWTWAWSGWSPGEKIGVCFDTGGGMALLNVSWVLLDKAPTPGYGFTGTISVHAACDCDAPPLAAQPFAPPGSATGGWHATAWGGLPVPDPFLIKITNGAPTGFTTPIAYVSDRPAAGPTGPQACGTCFPSTRTVHSRYFGLVGHPYCPDGIALSDGACDIEFVMDVSLKRVTATEPRTWGGIKNLYR